MLAIAFALISALLMPGAQAPGHIDAQTLGEPSFYDNFQTTRICDPRLDPTCRGKHWLPTNGYPGASPSDAGNRTRAEAVFVEPAFPGVRDGVLQPTPLGLNPFRITGEYLEILATPTPSSLRPFLWNKAFVSGALSSKDLYTFTYGYAEFVADLPLCTRGAWPALWTSVTGGWPFGGEDDFPEDIGTGKHWFSNVNPTNKAAYGVHAIYTPSTGCQRAFHRYGALKTPTTVAFYYDGAKVGEFPATPDMHRPHDLLIDLAMGGPWVRSASGEPDPQGTTSMLVKEVKVWTAGGR